MKKRCVLKYASATLAMSLLPVVARAQTSGQDKPSLTWSLLRNYRRCVL